jgi:putative aldouronate transport system substrate-binding protein
VNRTPTAFGRRRFLSGALGAAITGVALSGCGDDRPGSSTAGDTTTAPAASLAPSASTGAGGSPGRGTTGSSASSAASGGLGLPAYAPYAGVKPDLPSTNELLLPAFYAYPAPSDLVQFTAKPPISSGKTVTVLTNTGTKLPPALGQNKLWQEFNKQAGAAVDFTMVPATDYLAKFQTAVAGDDLPEIVAIRPVVGLPNLLKERFTDLSEHLAGDNIKDYPGLANIPTTSWRSSLYDGGIYAIPIPRSPVSGEMAVRADIAAKRGGNLDIKSYQDFVALCRAVNDPDHRSWALGNPTTTLDFVREMLGNANGWAVDANGSFTYQAEQDTCKQAISAIASLWKEGLFEPDAYTAANKVSMWVGTGTVVMSNGSGTAGYYTTYKDTGVTPGLEMALIVPPSYDGGGPGHKYFGAGIYGSGVALRASSPARTAELLRFFEWLAAPFGTKEYLFHKYGVENVDFTYTDGAPARTKQGAAEIALPIGYTGAPAWINISAGHEDFTKAYYDWNEACIPIAMPMATLGLYSPTDQGKGAALTKSLTDLTNDIITGRKSIDAWDGAVKQWRSGGGDTIRKEYEAAYAASHS